MHIDPTLRRAYNIEPNMCWECYSCVKACPMDAIDVRGYADFAPLGHSVRVQRDEEKGVIAWRIKSRNGETDLKDEAAPTQEVRDSQLLFNEPKYIRMDEDGIHTLESAGLKMKSGVYY